MLEGNSFSALTVAIKMIAIFIRLFKTKIVAKRFLGPSLLFGSLKSLNTKFEDLFESDSSSSKSLGFKEKNATSEPEIRALHRISNATKPIVNINCGFRANFYIRMVDRRALVKEFQQFE